MTIQLYVEKYCDNCCNFEPSVEKNEIWAANQVVCHTTITCKHASICERLEKHLRKTMEENTCEESC